MNEIDLKNAHTRITTAIDAMVGAMVGEIVRLRGVVKECARVLEETEGASVEALRGELLTVLEGAVTTACIRCGAPMAPWADDATTCDYCHHVATKD